MMVLEIAGLVRVGVVGVGLATAAYVLAELAIGGVLRELVAVMLTCWGARVGVVGMPAGWVIGGVGGSGSATGVVGAAGWVVGGGVGVSGAAMGLDGPVVAWVVGAVRLWWDMSMSGVDCREP